MQSNQHAHSFDHLVEDSEALEDYTPFDLLDESSGESEDEPVYELEEEQEEEENYLEGFNESETGDSQSKYVQMGLSSKGLSSETFEIALNGYQKLLSEGKLKKTNILTIVDFNQPGDKKRMYVLDLTASKVLLQCKVSHGKNSVKKGDHKKNATQFSNRIGSNQSSLGFYVTSKTYQGKHGLSLVLEGKETNFNSNSARRKVVVHGADYVREDDKNAAGLSWGCPAIDMKLVNKVIPLIKEGSCFFIFYSDATYLRDSQYISQGLVNTIRNAASGIFNTASNVLSTIASNLPNTGALPVKTTSKLPEGVDASTVKRINAFDGLINQLSNELGVKSAIAKGIIAAESGGNPRSGEGKTGYKGLMQAGREVSHLDPKVSIRRGMEKFKEFQGYLKKGLSYVNIKIDFPQDESYYKVVLACYNAGHVTVIKAIQYAHQNGNWREWLSAENYQRALLFSGGYDFYSACMKGASASETANARAQRTKYRFTKNKKWYLQKDPPSWNSVSPMLSPVLKCWIETKRKNTPGYLNRFAGYFRYYSMPVAQKETEDFSSAEWQQESMDYQGMDSESIHEFEVYGPEYFDVQDESEFGSFETENELEEELEDEDEQFESTDDGEDEAIDEKYFYEMEDTETAYENYADFEAAADSSLPKLIGDDTSVPGYTCYVRIPIGKGNYPLDKTGIFFPSGFDPARPVTAIVYLHGMTGAFPGATAMIDKYWTVTKLPAYDLRIREEVNKAGKNVVLIAPSLGNSPNAYKNSLSSRAGGFDSYMQMVTDAVNAQIIQKRFNGTPISFSSIVIAAHSAGGSQMRKLVALRNPVFGIKIKECWGFDSLYGGVYQWLKWARSNPGIKLVTYFKSSTAGNARLLKSRSKQLKNVIVIASDAANHFWVPKHHFSERIREMR